MIRVELAGMTLECVVDAGFSGGVLIPFPTFKSLRLMSRVLPDEYQAMMPDSTRVPVYTTKAQVTAGISRILTLVHASPILERTLVGRAFLGCFVTTPDGPDEMPSLWEQDSRDGALNVFCLAFASGIRPYA